MMSSILPMTAVVAILLFIFKEIKELLSKRKSKKNKLQAIKKVTVIEVDRLCIQILSILDLAEKITHANSVKRFTSPGRLVEQINLNNSDNGYAETVLILQTCSEFSKEFMVEVAGLSNNDFENICKVNNSILAMSAAIDTCRSFIDENSVNKIIEYLARKELKEAISYCLDVINKFSDNASDFINFQRLNNKIIEINSRGS